MSFLFQIYEMKIGNYLECFVDIINGLKGCQTCLVGFENEINALSHAVSIEHAKKVIYFYFVFKKCVIFSALVNVQKRTDLY